MSTGTIHYGFGSEYLPEWKVAQALREIYQNFLDYGDYDEEFTYVNEDKSVVEVKLTNGWEPQDLQYLRIGNSNKGDNTNAIGHHGEGLKMAFLILLREGFKSNIFTSRYSVWPDWYQDNEIGDCFAFQYEIHDMYEAPYSLTFQCNAKDFKEFKDKLLQPEDIIHTNSYWGDLVAKPKGDIYSGRLFVCNMEKVGRAYNILPNRLPLDRDRCAPRTVDIQYATSQILESSNDFDIDDLDNHDSVYLSSVPEKTLKRIKPRRVGNDIQFTIKDNEGKDKVITNPTLKANLQTNGFFKKAIAGIKRFLAKQLGVYDMLLEFKKKHHLYGEALQDFELILEKVNK